MVNRSLTIASKTSRSQILVAIGVFLCVMSISSRGVAQATANADSVTKVSADRLEINEQTGVQTLSGNVVITQDNLTIFAETIQVSLDNNAIYRIYGAGSPVRFTQLDENGETITASSNEIDYVTRTWKIVFTGDVKLERGGWKVKSNIVEYNVRTRDYFASRATESDSSSRVSFTYTVPGLPSE